MNYLHANIKLKEHKYKERVNREGISLDIKNIDTEGFDLIIYNHLCKAINLMDSHDFNIDQLNEKREQYRDDIVSKLFQKEIAIFNEAATDEVNKTVIGDVISTCWCFIEEAYPKKLFKQRV